MRIESFYFKNFKSFKGATTFPLAPLTVLVGQNASGKSNAIEAIKLFSLLEKGSFLDVINSGGGGFIRGTPHSLFNEKDEAFKVGCCVDSDSDNGFFNPLFSLKMIDDKLHIITHPSMWLREYLKRTIEGIVFIEPQPEKMRGYSLYTDDILSPTCANISSVLHKIERNDSSKECDQEKAILDFISPFSEKNIFKINFTKTPDLVQFSLFEIHNFMHAFPSNISDGMLKILAIATALLSAPTGGLVVIEGIDSCIYPSLAETLLEKIYFLAKERNLTIILVSNHPTLLDKLPEVVVPNVVCCYRDSKGDSRLIRLEDSPFYEELLAQGTLGDLMTRGILDRYLKEPQTLEERKETALNAWEQLKVPIRIEGVEGLHESLLKMRESFSNTFMCGKSDKKK